MKIRNIVMTAVVGLAACQLANAATWTTQVGGSALPNQNYETFDGTTFGMGVALTPDAKQVVGAASGLYAAPWFSGNNDLFFTPGLPPVGADGYADLTPYLTTGSSGSYNGAKIVMTFDTPQNYLGLLWGSIDDYNTITFKDKDGVVIDTLRGIQAYNAIHRPPESYLGDQNKYGTAYVNIWTVNDFTSVEFTSTQYAFEFDNMAYGHVPDAGASLSLLGLAIMGLGFYSRKIGLKA
jgi:hypothetical protein